MTETIVTVGKIQVWDDEFGAFMTVPDYDFTGVTRWEKVSETDTTITIRVYRDAPDSLTSSILQQLLDPIKNLLH